uniref:Uncharacterized protein n=1 Tax=Pyricularia oryzae (strain P131) TaxID=1143193 RepID=L7JCJ6_PYRO1
MVEWRGGVVRDDGVLLSVAGATGPPHLRLSRRNATSSPGPRDKKGKTFDGEMKSLTDYFAKAAVLGNLRAYVQQTSMETFKRRPCKGPSQTGISAQSI